MLSPLVKETTEIRKLPSGLNLCVQSHTDGGGFLAMSSFMDVVRSAGRDRYQHALEWCSGPGILGFELLGQKLCQHWTFQDLYPLAIDLVKETARLNNIESQVLAVLADSIQSIPSTDKWDLVIGNPPHAWDLENVKQSLKEQMIPENVAANLCRVVVDDNMNAHKEFFSNISPRLTSDADLFIVEHDNIETAKLAYLQMAAAGGLTFINSYPCMWGDLDHGHRVYHFKRTE